jgi:hypothetical protein
MIVHILWIWSGVANWLTRGPQGRPCITTESGPGPGREAGA